MAIDLYSKSSVDTLLAGKLSDAPSDGSTYGRKDGAWEIVSGGGGGLTISTLSNGATSTLNSTAPTTGQALTFDGTDLVWATVGGGGGWTPGSSDLDLNGYALVNGGYAQFSNTVTVQGSFGYAILGGDYSGAGAKVTITDYTNTLTVGATGITFPDSTVQTTAAVAGYNTNKAMADGIAMMINYLPFYSYYLQFTFSGTAPYFISNLGSGWGITDGSTFYPFSYLSGNTAYFAMSWTSGTLHVQVNGEVSSIPLPY